LGAGCNFKSIEETQQKSPVDTLLEDRQAELDKKEADLKMKEAELQKKADEIAEQEEAEEGEPKEGEEGSGEEGEPEEGEGEAEEAPEEVVKNLNEREREVLRDFTVEAGDNDITIFLVVSKEDYNDYEPVFEIGCDDFLVLLKVELEEKNQSDLATSIVELLTTKRAQYKESDGLLNAVSGVGLTLDNVKYEDGLRVLEFTGEPKSSGTCESPRIKAQIEETAALYSNNFEIRLNGSEADWRCLFDESGQCS